MWSVSLRLEDNVRGQRSGQRSVGHIPSVGGQSSQLRDIVTQSGGSEKHLHSFHELHHLVCVNINIFKLFKRNDNLVCKMTSLFFFATLYFSQ